MATQTEIDNLSPLSGKPLIDSLDKYTKELQDELTTLSNTLNRIYDLLGRWEIRKYQTSIENEVTYFTTEKEVKNDDGTTSKVRFTADEYFQKYGFASAQEVLLLIGELNGAFQYTQDNNLDDLMRRVKRDK